MLGTQFILETRFDFGSSASYSFWNSVSHRQSKSHSTCEGRRSRHLSSQSRSEERMRHCGFDRCGSSLGRSKRLDGPWQKEQTRYSTLAMNQWPCSARFVQPLIVVSSDLIPSFITVIGQITLGRD